MSFFSSLFGGGADVQHARDLLQKGATILDVRSPAEFAAGHVEGAVNIPVDVLGARLSQLGPKTRPVVLYCRSGARSAAAASMLKQAGYTEIADVGAMSNFPR